MDNRRLLIAIIAVTLFALGVISWFFFYATPKSAPTLSGTSDPLSLKQYPKGFQFVFGTKSEEPKQESTTEVTFKQPEVLTQIWNKPATGQTFIDSSFVIEVDATTTKGTSTVAIKKLDHATTTLLMFVDRTTGYVYAYNRSLGKVYQVSNTTIPGVYDAYIFNKGKNIIIRYPDNEKHTIVGVLATIPEVTEKMDPKPLESISNLPSQVSSVAVNKRNGDVSYLVIGDKGSSIYTIQKNTKLPIFVSSSPFTEWDLAYSAGDLFATTKPSAYVEGQTVIIPSFDFIIGGKTGLMSNPGDSGIFLESMWSNTGLKTFLSLYGRQAILSIQTLASKCAWGENKFLICAVPKTLPRKSEGLPDDWFQGRVSFDDSLFLVNPSTGETSEYFTFDKEKFGVFDINNFSLSSKNTYISFTKKQDSTLWLLDTSLISH